VQLVVRCWPLPSGDRDNEAPRMISVISVSRVRRWSVDSRWRDRRTDQPDHKRYRRAAYRLGNYSAVRSSARRCAAAGAQFIVQARQAVRDEAVAPLALVGVYADVGVSGATLERPALLGMLQDASGPGEV
jgi:hypothetical protein